MFGFDRAGEQIAENSDWSGRRRDVTPEPGMAVEQRVIKYQACGLLKQALRIGSVIGELVLRAQGLTNRGDRFPRRYGPLRQRGKEIGDSIDELVSQASELLRGDFDWRLAVSQVLDVLIILHGTSLRRRSAGTDRLLRSDGKHIGWRFRTETQFLAQSIEEIGFSTSAAIHQAEDTVEFLRSPHRAMVLLGEALQLRIDGELSLVAADGPPHGLPMLVRVQGRSECPVRPRRRASLDAVNFGL